MDVLFCTLLNDVEEHLTNKQVVLPKELVLVAGANPPRLFPKAGVRLLYAGAELLLVFPNIDDVLLEEVNPPPPNGLLFCTNVLFPNIISTLLVDALLARPK